LFCPDQRDLTDALITGKAGLGIPLPDESMRAERERFEARSSIRFLTGVNQL